VGTSALSLAILIMYLFIAADKGEPPISYAPEHFKTKVFFQTFFMQVPKRAENHQLFSFSFVQIGAIRVYWERGASRQKEIQDGIFPPHSKWF
jgi:hypothetical protein